MSAVPAVSVKQFPRARFLKCEPLYAANPEGWKYVPFVMGRIYRFCKNYDMDTGGASLCQTLMANHAVNSPNTLAMALVDGNGVFGHVVLMKDQYYERKFVTVVQVEIDHPVTSEFRKIVIRQINKYADLVGAQFVSALTRTRSIARLNRRYGFQEIRQLTRATRLIEA